MGYFAKGSTSGPRFKKNFKGSAKYTKRKKDRAKQEREEKRNSRESDDSWGFKRNNSYNSSSDKPFDRNKRDRFNNKDSKPFNRDSRDRFNKKDTRNFERKGGNPFVKDDRRSFDKTSKFDSKPRRFSFSKDKKFKENKRLGIEEKPQYIDRKKYKRELRDSKRGVKRGERRDRDYDQRKQYEERNEGGFTKRNTHRLANLTKVGQTCSDEECEGKKFTKSSKKRKDSRKNAFKKKLQSFSKLKKNNMY